MRDQFLTLRRLSLHILFFLFTISTGTLLAQEVSSAYPPLPEGIKPTNLTPKELKEVEELKERHLKMLKRGDYKEASRCLNLIALTYWNHMKLWEAIDYYDSSLVLNEKVGNNSGIAKINNNLGMIYSDLLQFDKSYNYFYMTLKERKANKEKLGVYSALINLAVVAENLNKNKVAIEHLQEALSIAIELNDVPLMRSCYGMLSENYEKVGDMDNAKKNFELYRTFNEMVHRVKETAMEKDKDLMKLRAELAETQKEKKELELKAVKEELGLTKEELYSFETQYRDLLDTANIRDLQIALLKTEEKEKNMKLERQKELNEWHKQQTKYQRIQRNFFIVLTLLCIVVLALFWKSYQEKKSSNIALQEKQTQILEQNLLLSEKNKNIQKSINYAKRIQSGVMEPLEHLSHILPESFIFFQPCSTVSGDFYWFKEVERDGERLVLLAGVDCTGHGVPGAFVSLLGKSFLDQVVAEGIIDPDQVLLEMDYRISRALHKDSHGTMDGMDMAFCVINREKAYMEYAGAHFPLVYFQDGEVNYIKGARYSIGGYHGKGRKPHFPVHRIDITKPTRFYTYSDGYIDQFGGKKDRRFTSKRMRELLKHIHQDNSERQKELLQVNLKNWMKETSQTDDILVIGALVCSNMEQEWEGLQKHSNNRLTTS
ncbi:SpoIIE family protein phosphatase [Algivirga pacifica]|uniref:PPM-type phosphatase domain-containing protein n=1 Tax=Algivirga pacifica TaxID=1162670 RepID=A0ABP9D1F7_9BACT